MTNNNEVDIQELRRISSWLAAAEIEFAEIRHAGSTVRLTLEPAASTSGEAGAIGKPSPAAGPTSIVRSPSTGIFVTTHPDRAAPQAAIGHRVEAGNVVGLLQIAELYRPVVAERGGVISAIPAEPGGLVGYGAPLFELAADVPPPYLPRIERADDGN
ncbi:acetyl-CoA carboxylase biotin carboxyl carrier protein [Burkholderia pyrrocinia]|uniref:Acetyl-CoA carboxylase biotin carboxyl carrier protein subunit n=1 Tax=Burkholderia pyrrocinia TaxID=60550 RepID=A0ABZ3BXY2_BURPY